MKRVFATLAIVCLTACDGGDSAPSQADIREGVTKALDAGLPEDFIDGSDFTQEDMDAYIDCIATGVSENMNEESQKIVAQGSFAIHDEAELQAYMDFMEGCNAQLNTTLDNRGAGK